MKSLLNKLIVIFFLAILGVSGILCSKMPDPLLGWGNKVTVSTGTFQSPTSNSVVISNSSITCKTDPLVGKERGVCWSDSAGNVTIQRNKIISGSGIGTYNSTITNLLPAKTYYYRSYVIVIQPSIAIYGELKSFNTPAACPVLTSTAATTITRTSAIIGGTITADGGAPVTARGVVYSSSVSSPTIGAVGVTTVTGSSGIGTYGLPINNLAPATTYFFRSYATNSAGTCYGNVLSFTTLNPIVCPTVSTNAASAITAITATVGGNVTADGGDVVTARGVVYSSSNTNPAIGGVGVTNALGGAGLGVYNIGLSGLAPGTTYYMRAYATNSAGTCYGPLLSFATNIQVVCPSLTTTAASFVTTTTATIGGNITADGGSIVTARGVVYSNSNTSPTVGGVGVTNATGGTGIGAYGIGISGLAPATTYYIRAYATSSAGTCYGATLSFVTLPIVCPTLTTTAASAVTSTSATLGGNITNDGGAAVTARGVVFSTTNTNPTVGGVGVSNAPGGTGTGAYGIGVGGLAAGTTYYIRAYATNSAGTCYGTTLSFTTLSPIVCPSLTTTAASFVTTTTATIGGNITADGGSIVTARGVVYSSSNTSPTVGGVGVTNATGGTGIGAYGIGIGGLAPATTYYIRAYATSSAGTCYGATLSFVTLPIVCPTLTTTAASAITATSATLGGNITNDGGAAVTARGVLLSTTNTSPAIGGAGVINIAGGSGVGGFALGVGGLASGTTYYIRAYATNSAGTCYGTTLSFTTLSPVTCPTLTTTAASAITATTATLGGNVTADGGAPVTARGVVVSSTTTTPIIGGVGVSNLSGGTGLGAFAIAVSGFAPGTTYYIRAYATNSSGTCYGAILSFTSSPVGIVCPTVVTDVPTNLTSTTVTLTGNVTSDGGSAVTDKGILVSSTTSAPTLGAAGVFTASAGAGIGAYGFNLSGLAPRTTYYIRAYATNSAGTCYGVVRSFITP